jgi:hypothetical protein
MLISNNIHNNKTDVEITFEILFLKDFLLNKMIIKDIYSNI